MYAFFAIIFMILGFILKKKVHRGESSRATRIGAAECISPSPRKAFWPSRATPLSQHFMVIHFLSLFFVIFTVLGEFRLPNGVRRFGASRGRPGRRLNRTVPS